jgi:hypothetical protein
MREDAFEDARNALNAYLALQGVAEVMITLSAEQPKQHEKSGKFKHILNMDV